MANKEQRNIPSVEQLIREHSKARVLTPSTKLFTMPQLFGDAMPRLSRQMQDGDVVQSMVNKYAK